MAAIAASRAEQVFRAGDGFAVLTRISVEKAQRREAMGIYRREYDNATGELLGFRLVQADLRKVDQDVKSIASRPSIALREMEINLARSGTRGMSEERRLERIGRGKAPEDVVERVQAKVRVYAVIGAARGDILRVWPK